MEKLNLEQMENKFGAVDFAGKKYILTGQADLTGRRLPFFDFRETEDGEEFDFEMSAEALDAAGNKFFVYWIFTDAKDSQKELDDFDYEKVDRIEEC